MEVYDQAAKNNRNKIYCLFYHSQLKETIIRKFTFE